ncbi:MAG: MaoC family dehydratase [Pseudomonadales bacterium]
MTSAPYFEDFEIGDDFSDVPSVTLTDGHAAIHQSMFGDRLRLPLDHPLCEAVTGHARGLVHPSLVCNFAIGQSTFPSQRVMGNLFYRGLLMRRPVFIGDTLTTTTRVVALKQNRVREDRDASGMVALEIQVNNQRNETVMLFWRCPMIPCRDPRANTGRADDFSTMPEEISMSEIKHAVPDWDFGLLQKRLGDTHYQSLQQGQTIEVDARDTVTLAPELVRLTLNMAMTHTDAARSVYGKRLVYGGHTIAMAAAQLSRALPGLVTLLAWYRCDHTGPVFEQDILRSIITVEQKTELETGGIVDMKVEVYATRGSEAPEAGKDIKILDWKLAGLFV